jgi:hypothetical protein
MVRAMPLPPVIRLRPTGPELLGLPWTAPLGAWPADGVRFQELPVGPSRHLVRFVRADGALYALKELPLRIARKEYAALRSLEAGRLPAVRAIGLVEQPEDENAVLVTRYLDHSWQFRRLFLRLASSGGKHRERLFDAMAGLLVELHAAGVFWGDCSLANTLFKRDGQRLQAFFVDAETSEVHAGSISQGQRLHDIAILIENVAGDLADLDVLLGHEPDFDGAIEQAESVGERYEQLWSELHREVTLLPKEGQRIDARVRGLNDLGFDVDELTLEPAGEGREELRLRVAVSGRSFHSGELRRLTGLEVGEGQATILLSDLRAFQTEQETLEPGSAPDEIAGHRWLHEVLEPGRARAGQALGGEVEPIQAYCDLLEVRWLLSEQAGSDVGDEVALAALAARHTPTESAAEMVVAEEPAEPVEGELASAGDEDRLWLNPS